jgi:ankyrin repeat protein
LWQPPIGFNPTDPRKPNLDLGREISMGSLLDKDQSEESNVEIEALNASRARRNRLLAQDALGRTPLFYAAEKGRMEEVREIIFSFRGTGLFPARLSLITIQDHSGLTAADVAEHNGHEEIASLLRSEEVRMEYYE